MTLLALFAVMLGGVALAALARAFALPRMQADARLRQIDAYGYTPGPDSLVATPRRSATADLALKLGRWLSPRVGGRQDDLLRKELLAAGMYKLEPRALLGYRALLTGAGVIIGLVGDPTPIAGPLLDTAGFAVAGWMLPVTFVRRRARFRLRELDRAVPDVIDLIVVIMEAGSGFGGALKETAGRTKGPLGDELRLTLQEQQFGISLEESLTHMLQRADTPNMRSLVRGVTQGESLGVSIGAIMRNLAQEMRVRRRQSAEERAQKAPVKMLFPLVFLILPSLLIVVLAPALMDISKVLGG
jgi:tight adherence protein C